jgi:hypothetical protein
MPFTKARTRNVSNDFRLPANQKADVDLKLQIDTSDAAKGSDKLTPLIAFFGPSLTPSLGMTISNTVINEYKFTMRQTVAGQGKLRPGVCPLIRAYSD